MKYCCDGGVKNALGAGVDNDSAMGTAHCRRHDGFYRPWDSRSSFRDPGDARLHKAKPSPAFGNALSEILIMAWIVLVGHFDAAKGMRCIGEHHVSAKTAKRRNFHETYSLWSRLPSHFFHPLMHRNQDLPHAGQPTSFARSTSTLAANSKRSSRLFLDSWAVVWQAGDKDDVKLKPQAFMDKGFVPSFQRITDVAERGDARSDSGGGDVAQSFSGFTTISPSTAGDPKRVLAVGLRLARNCGHHLHV